MNKNNIEKCMKERLKPWIVGLVVLVIIVLGWITLGKKGKSSIWNERIFSGKIKYNPPNQPTTTQQDSYHNIVELVRQSVVGISLPGAQPFLQRLQNKVLWPSKEAEGEAPLTGPLFQQQAVQQNPTLSMPCPNCGTIVTRQPQTPWSSVVCPNCGNVMFCPRVGNPVQQQLWTQPSAQSTTKEEYLLCPNCNVRINQQPGIPWSGAKCPNCSTTMARVIKETPLLQQQVWQPSTQPAQQQVWNPSAQQQALAPPTQTQQTAQPGFHGLGSGVIVSKQGYIITNSHLVSGQKTVNVVLFTPQGQKTFLGSVVAQASDRDIAVIKIDPQNLDLPVPPIGDSDTVQVGDTVLAFGNPFGLAQTVTSGVVSAIRKSIIIEGHQLNNLIQTDAPINQGNAGGPLVNLKGEVIGINTAIYSPVETHTGLGFAVPINQVKEVFSTYMDLPVQQVNMKFLNYLRAYPTLAPQTGANEDLPVWLGINIQILNDIIAEQLGIPVDRGILVNEVYPNSPAHLAGLQKGDVIIRFDNKRITDETQIRKLLSKKKHKDRIRLTVLRGRKKINLVVELISGPWQQAAFIYPTNLLKGAEIETGTADITSLGITVNKITPEIAFAYNLPQETKGVIITEVEGLALNCGVKEGDIIAGVNNRKVDNLVSLFKALKKSDLQTGVLLNLIRKGLKVDVVVREQPQNLPKGL